MKKVWNIFAASILLSLLSLFVVTTDVRAADPTTYFPENEEEYDSMIKWENYIYSNKAASHTCSGKMVTPASDQDNICIPSVLSKDEKTCDKGGAGDTSKIVTGVLVGVLSGGVALLPALVVAGAISYGIMTDVCASIYVMAPHEVINNRLGKKCVDDGTKVTWQAGSITAADFPYFFHCDPTYDPISDSAIPADKPEWIGRTMGYVGGASPLCSNPLWSGQLDTIKHDVNSIYVNGSNWTRRVATYAGNSLSKYVTFGIVDTPSWTPCESARGAPEKVVPGKKSAYIFPTSIDGYYRINSTTGKVQICAVATTTFMAIRIGCTTIAPPGDETNIDSYLKYYVQDTRCAYLIKPREDLQSLGAALQVDVNNPVKKFLQSDMHITSTVIGCIKDMLVKIFVKSPNTVNQIGPKPFFQVFQARMHDIVYATLLLFVTIVGLKIMTAGQPPQKAELIMYAVKFALVVYFAVGGGFYEVKDGQVEGLFPQLLKVPDELADIFLQAQNINDPARYCYLQYGASNILGENDIGISEFGGRMKATEGSKGSMFVTMTVWDLVDCKIVNYLTLGSCNYTLSGMMSAWFSSAAMLSSKIGIILGIVSFFYTVFVLITMFRFAHIFILCMFTITILIFLAPIFLLFMLFDPTKNITTKWFQNILAYLLYPALLFAFVALMFATFDAIFYGNLNTAGADAVNVDYKAACAGVDSVFCKTQELISYENPCTTGSITSKLISLKTPVEGAGEFNTLKDEAAEAYYYAMLKMLLFAFLFYLFLGSVTEFMAVMLGVVGFGDISKGIGVIASPLAAIGGFAAKTGAKAGASVAGGALGAAGAGAAKGAQAAGRKISSAISSIRNR